MRKHIRRFAEFSEGKKLNKGELESLKMGARYYIFSRIVEGGLWEKKKNR